MTKDKIIEKTKERIAVMQAFVEGKDIQYLPQGCVVWQDFQSDIPNPSWGWDCIDYRVKPEPIYEPYTAETFFKEAVKHNFTIKNKLTSTHMRIDTWNDGGWVAPSTRNTYFWSLMLSEWIWADDGSPTGILTNNDK